MIFFLKIASILVLKKIHTHITEEKIVLDQPFEKKECCMEKSNLIIWTVMMEIVMTT